MKTSSASINPVKLLKREWLYHMKEAQYDEYDGDNDQSVDPISGFWETWTYVPTEKAKQP
jgi:hypothetical protein